MSTKVKYWRIFNPHLKELTDNVDTNANPSEDSRAILFGILSNRYCIDKVFMDFIIGGGTNRYT